MTTSTTTRAEVKLGLRRLLVEQSGQIDINQVRTLYPEVAGRTLSRWLKEVRDEMASDGATKHEERTLTTSLTGASTLEAWKGERRSAFGWLGQLAQVHEDANALRRYACGEVLPSDPQIRNPILFEKSIKLRLASISEGTKLIPEIYTAERTQEFYDAIVEEVGHCDKAAQERIMIRLAALDESWGGKR